MPATRVVILEKRRTIESRILLAGGELPVEIKPVRNLEEFTSVLKEVSFVVAFIEHESDLQQTIKAVEIAARHSAKSLVFLRSPCSKEARLSLRVAGATSLLSELPERNRLGVLLEQLVRESQEEFRLAGGH